MGALQVRGLLVILAALMPGVQAGCNADNCLRALNNPTRGLSAHNLCTSLLATSTSGGAPMPTFVNNCGAGDTQTVRASSACSCFLATQTAVPTTTTTTSRIVPTLTTSISNNSAPPPTSTVAASSCPAPSTITVTLGGPSTTATCAPPSTTTITETETETETETAAASSCVASSTASAPTSTATCGPGTSCSSLFLNTGFDEFNSIGASLNPWYFWAESSVANLVVNVQRSPGPISTGFWDTALRVDNLASGFRAFVIGQVIRPCPGVRYYLRATVFCGTACPAGSDLYAFMDVYRKTSSSSSWSQIVTGRDDHPNVTPGQATSIVIGLDDPYSSDEGLDEGVGLIAEFHLRFVPGISTVPWTLWIDNVEMVAVPETS